MTIDRAALAKRHVEHKRWPLVKGDIRTAEDGYIHACRADGEPWPCTIAELLNLAADATNVAALGEALHEVYCRRNAPMHSAPDHSASAIAIEYARRLTKVSA